ncbi:MAG: hypothetical protein KKD99_02085, partial [Proteobacteria bacterium]|nr:hypothetical protein [Pseudomonadota bacterium]
RDYAAALDKPVQKGFSGPFRLNPPTWAASVSRDILTRNTTLPTPKVSRKIQISHASPPQLFF